VVPGEQLPRWSLTCSGARTAKPIWTHPELIANEHQAYGATEAESRRMLEGVARRMGVDPANVFAAYEDTHYYLWRERKLPSNVDPLDARLADPFERERLRKVFSQGLRKVVGHGLPIARSPARNGAGARPPGSCATSTAISCRAIRRSATGCRSNRSRGPRRTTCRGSIRPIRTRTFRTWRRTSSRNSSRTRVCRRHRRRMRPTCRRP
jgi:hypothetical protein